MRIWAMVLIGCGVTNIGWCQAVTAKRAAPSPAASAAEKQAEPKPTAAPAGAPQAGVAPVSAPKPAVSQPAAPQAAAAQPAAAQPTAGTPAPAEDPESAAIRATSAAFVAAFNKRDAKALAALWTEQGEYADDQGRRFDGRAEIEKGYSEFFATQPPAEIRLEVDSIKRLNANTAIETGRAVLGPDPARAPGFSQYTVVHVKENGQWLMASVRDVWIEQATREQGLADLEWLVGTWISEEHGVVTESVCSWVVDKQYISRQYTVRQPDGNVTSGLQLIGWNAASEQVQSWNFSPDGGHAVGTWSQITGGWMAQLNGITGDGLPTTSVNLLQRLDDNAYLWQSVQRTLGGTALPDTDQVVLKRQTPRR